MAKSPPPDDGKGGKSAAFRETLWFKKGDVEHMIAEAKAKMGVDKPAEPEALAAVDDMKPLEDRYVDDGSVSIDDRKKFSLRTGGTSAAMPTSGARGRAVPGESMTEADMVNEVSSGKKNLIYVAAGVGAIVLVIFVLSMMRGKDVKEVPPAPSPTAAAVPAPPPVVAKPPVVAPAVPVAPAAGGPAAETAASAVKKPGSDKKKSASPHGSRSVDKKKKR